MKRIFFILFCLVSFCISDAQPSKAEIEAMQKKWQRQMDSLRNDPKTKKYFDNSSSSVSGRRPVSTDPSLDRYGGKDFDKLTLPAKDSARINSIPKKTFSLQELGSYLTGLHTLLAKKLPADAVSSADAIATKLENNPLKLEAAAMLAWENGSMEEALLLITKSASRSDDGILLTNTGAILDMSGLSEKAVPVLRTVVNYAPQNSIALNNLGQAFTALGMQDSAIYYFSRCLQLSPQNPEANSTAGYIELKKGNQGKAQSYFENSIRGSFNVAAYAGLKSILKDRCRIAELIRPKVKLPEYFNQFKYKPPPQCLNVNEAATREAEYDAFKKMLSAQMQKLQKKIEEAEQKMAAKIPEMNKTLLDKAMHGEKVVRPFQVLGGIMESEAMLDYRKDKMDLEKFNTENRQQYKELEDQYKKDYDALVKKNNGEDGECCGEGNSSCCDKAQEFCKEANELKNKYLIKFAQLNEEWQSRNMLIENKYIDDLLFWCYFSAMDDDDYRGRFYHWAYNYLYSVSQLVDVKILEPCEVNETEEPEKPEPAELKEFDCPVDVQIPFIVGKMTMNCEKFSFKAGELIVFKYEKKFTGDRQSTICIGIGGGVDASIKAGPVKAGIEAGMDMSAYSAFDKQGNCVDGGMVYSAHRGMGIDFSAGERLKMKKNLGYAGEEIGWRFGLNSGISFTPPSNPYFKDQREKPLNKNVKIYKPN